MSILTTDLLRRWQEEYAKRKEPIDSDIEKRRKTASNPPKDAIPGLDPNGGADPNPDNSTAPSPDLPAPGSKDKQKQDAKRAKGETPDSFEKPPKPSPDSMQWFMGHAFEPVLDEHTGLAKWPLSFKRIEKDTKRPGKPGNPKAAHPGIQKPEQPPTAA